MAKKPNRFEDFVATVPKDGEIHFEYLHDIDDKALALVHFVTPAKDRFKYMDVDVYKIRTWNKDGSPDFIQHFFTMNNKFDGEFTLSFTQSPVKGTGMAELENLYSLMPYVYTITPDKISNRFAGVSDKVH